MICLPVCQQIWLPPADDHSGQNPCYRIGLPPTHLPTIKGECHKQGNAIFRILVIFAHLCTSMGDPSTPYLNFYGLEHCSGDNFLRSMLKKNDWYPLKPLSTHHQQGNAIFRIVVGFAHLCTAKGDPLTPHLKFYGLKHCFKASFLRSMLMKSDWHPF